MSSNILEVKDLRTHFFTDKGVVKAVDGVSFKIQAGKTLCVVGESGCGKSVTSMSVMGLVSKPGKIMEGSSITYMDTELTQMSDDQYRSVRGNEISMIFQEPMTSLNPVFKIGFQISEVLILHKKNDEKKKPIRNQLIF